MTPRRPQRSARSLAVLLALVANLIAAGVPVLHALAHEAAEGHHPESELSGLSHAEHGHDEVHAEALHDERLVTNRHALDLAVVLPVDVEVPASFTSPARVTHRPALPLASRAPPATDLARAPPLA